MSTCYHCGDKLPILPIKEDDKLFCCKGCLQVHQLLANSGLGQFYQLNEGAGTKPNNRTTSYYDFLDNPELANRFILFRNNSQVTVNLYLPSIHCSSCIYLLENLQKVNPGIAHVNVDFSLQTARISFNEEEISFRELAELLDKIGYKPQFASRKVVDDKNRKIFLYQLGVAGFAFGSIMLWIFPEYLGLNDQETDYQTITNWLSILVSVPVLVFSARDYFISSFKSLRMREINLDVPISIGILALFFQSLFSVLLYNEPGYIDSFASFVFLLLIGKWAQKLSYKYFTQEQDISTYFPVSHLISVENQWSAVIVEEIKPEQIIRLRKNEVLACSGVLESEQALLDYSFITGESEPVQKYKGDHIYAGGKLLDTWATICAKETSDRSEFAKIWTNKVEKDKTPTSELSKWFLSIVLLVAALSAVAWYFIDPTRILEIVVAVLIVACPCALALSRPFILGAGSRRLGAQGLYLRSPDVLEKLQYITAIVFDKTGTLTEVSGKITTEAQPTFTEEIAVLVKMTELSNHPKSRMIYEEFAKNSSTVSLSSWEEIPGEGLKAQQNEDQFLLGSGKFTNQYIHEDNKYVYFTKNGELLASFDLSNPIRPGVKAMLIQIQQKYRTYLLSGDHETMRPNLEAELGQKLQIQLEKKPSEKAEFITQLKDQHKVMMIGDGLNDSGAIAVADIGISVSEDNGQFVPQADGILVAEAISELPNLLKIADFAKTLLRVSILFSLTYNSIGLFFAVTGKLSPLVAAIIMPISSLTVVAIALLGYRFLSLKKN